MTPARISRSRTRPRVALTLAVPGTGLLIECYFVSFLFEQRCARWRHYELEVGIAKSSGPHKRSEQLADLISTVQVLSFGLEEAKSAAQIRGALEVKGQPIGPLDALIAATALANHAVLVSHNTPEFSKIPKLQLEDWFL
jgi:tRNA(fMet)-specific endonuclease VapC